MIFFVGSDEISSSQLRKRKIPYTLKLEKKIRKLEDENKNLKHELKCSQESNERNLQLQANSLNTLNEQQKAQYKAKITEKNKQLKALRVTVNRKDNKIKDLLLIIKNKNLISNESYQILNNEFGEMTTALLKNECKNQDKPAHGRRYDDEVKKFAVTLHYHSPKAYGYCRSAFGFGF